MDTEKCDQQIGNKVIKIQIEDLMIDGQEYYYLNVIQSLVAAMFKNYKEHLSEEKYKNNNCFEDKKDIILKFEKVMKCIRYQVTDLKDLYKNNADDLELLVQLSEVTSLEQALRELIDEYCKIYGGQSIQIIHTNAEEVAKAPTYKFDYEKLLTNLKIDQSMGE